MRRYPGIVSFKKCRDLILGAVMLLFSGFYLVNAMQIKTRPKLTPSYGSAQIMPILLGSLLAILSVILIIQAIRKMKTISNEEEGKKADKGGLMTVSLTFAVIIGYTMLMEPLGFCLSTVIYLFLQMLVLAPREKRNYLLFAIVAVAFTAIVYFAFRVGLQQLLPRGVLESLMGF